MHSKHKNNLRKKQDLNLFIEAMDNNENKKLKTVFFEKKITQTKEEIDEFLKKVNELYTSNNYNSANFSGWSSYEAFKANKEKNNPDLFEDNIYLNLKKKRSALKSVNIEKTKVTIDIEIENLEDLIKLINDYPINDKVEYNINMASLYKIKDPLIELNNMIGMKLMKENIVDQILYYIQDLHKVNTNSEGDFMHTVIYGPPGTGKTEVAKILGRIFANLGILKKGTFKKVTRADLVAGYLGQTAIKTRDVINDCLGGCLFIDEAYALGNNEKRDSFSKECIDTLCESLSDHKNELMVIIAGYEKELNECFFSYNQGLDSRFTWRFKTEDYKANDLYKIFLKKVKDSKWSLNSDDIKINNETEVISWFNKNMDYFKFFGRDIETLLSKIKIAHSRRVFCKCTEEKTKLTFKDLEKGLQIYLKNDEVKNRKEYTSRKNYLQSTMYV